MWASLLKLMSSLHRSKNQVPDMSNKIVWKVMHCYVATKTPLATALLTCETVYSVEQAAECGSHIGNHQFHLPPWQKDNLEKPSWNADKRESA